MMPPTEQRNPASSRLSELSEAEVVALMNAEERRVLAAIDSASPQIAAAAARVAGAYRGGGRTVFIAGGTGALIALQEVAELPPTFGVAADRFPVLAAGGRLMGAAAMTNSEDDVAAAAAALQRLDIGEGDVVIALAASGTTPFVVAGLRAARRLGAWTCGMSSNPGTPLLRDGDLGIYLDTGPEVITGSTRLKAGTAQKLVLNRITTAAMVAAGRVSENHMIELTGFNDKLRQRAVRIVMDLARVDEQEARARLERAGWYVRDALRS
jgi:N-acetylmuramic acid 6-phosphate etherase